MVACHIARLTAGFLLTFSFVSAASAAPFAGGRGGRVSVGHPVAKVAIGNRAFGARGMINVPRGGTMHGFPNRKFGHHGFHPRRFGWGGSFGWGGGWGGAWGDSTIVVPAARAPQTVDTGANLIPAVAGIQAAPVERPTVYVIRRGGTATGAAEEETGAPPGPRIVTLQVP